MSLIQVHDFVRRHWRGTCRTPRVFVPLQEVAEMWANNPGIQGPAQGCLVELVLGRAGLGGADSTLGVPGSQAPAGGLKYSWEQRTSQAEFLRGKGRGAQPVNSRDAPGASLSCLIYFSQGPMTHEKAILTFIM